MEPERQFSWCSARLGKASWVASCPRPSAEGASRMYKWKKTLNKYGTEEKCACFTECKVQEPMPCRWSACKSKFGMDLRRNEHDGGMCLWSRHRIGRFQVYILLLKLRRLRRSRTGARKSLFLVKMQAEPWAVVLSLLTTNFSCLLAVLLQSSS